MKKNKFTEFFKGKGYYVLLFVGVLAIAAVAYIGSALSSDQKGEGDNYVDLNEPDNNIAAGEDDNQTSDYVANNGLDGNVSDGTNTNEDTNQVADNDRLLEFDVFTEAEEDGIDLAQGSESTDEAGSVNTTEEAQEEPDSVETAGTTVQADTKPVLDTLSFKTDDGLLWPVNGNVIMNYSMDHTIYHATLMLYKCNPAIIIDAEVGTEVKAAARGVISSIDTDPETGFTITTNIGDGYSLVYGQLSNDVAWEVGDAVDVGEVIGTIQEPTKYYSVEGSNLYFEVLENDQTVNPMLLLR